MALATSKKPTPEELELSWFHHHYRGDISQLTLRAVAMGACLGAIMSLTNLYIGLKSGWGFGVAITACVLSFAIWKSLRKIGIVRTDMTVLENNAMQSTASSAGYSTGGTLVSAIAAYLLVNGHHIPYGLLTGWIFFLAVLGVTLAIPMKRQMINIERLRFPSGIAAAMTLRSLHADFAHSPATEGPFQTAEEETVEEDLGDAILSAEQGEKSARGLFYAAGLGAVVTILRDGFAMLAEIGVLKKSFYIIQELYPIFGKKAMDYTIGLEGSVLFLGGGALMGIRVCYSVLLGAILNWAILVPWMTSLGIIESLTYRQQVSWSLWGGAACMVTSGLLAFAMQWRTIMRAFSGLGAIFNKGTAVRSPELLAMDKIEVPGTWFAGGALFGGLGVVILAKTAFGMPIWMAMVAVVLSFFLALVACRTTGETDTTPVGAMGKITQLFYGAIAPKQTNTNLMAACITAGVADSASDLLTDLKSGYVLGANPRKQFLAQFSGIFIGTAVTVPMFYVLVPNGEALGTNQWPAPAALIWASVANLLSNGFEALHPSARIGLLVGGLVGILLVLLPRWLPEKAQKWSPSPMGLGLAFTFHFFYAFSMFLGGLIAWIISKKAPQVDKTYTVPVASGLIAGESLMAIFIILIPLFLGIFFGVGGQ